MNASVYLLLSLYNLLYKQQVALYVHIKYVHNIIFLKTATNILIALFVFRYALTITVFVNCNILESCSLPTSCP